MDSDQLIDATDRNGRLLIAAAASSPDAPVAACPGWDNRQLMTHVARVHGWVAGAVTSGSIEAPTHPRLEPPARSDVAALAAWATEQLDTLLEALRATDPDQPMWTWVPEQRAGWYVRRMAHETLVHRWDAESAAGSVGAIDSDLAADGVDELIEVGFQHSMNPDKQFGYPAGSLHLHRTDGEGEWLLRADDGALVVTREHAKGDVAVRGTGPALLLYLWGRSRADLEIFGDESLAWQWAEVAP